MGSHVCHQIMNQGFTFSFNQLRSTAKEVISETTVGWLAGKAQDPARWSGSHCQMAFSFVCASSFRGTQFRVPHFRSVCHHPRRSKISVSSYSCSAITSSTARLRLEINTVAGEERGIFGLEDEQREALENLIQAVEDENPAKVPTSNGAEAVSGTWRLLYTNLEILGRRRVRLAIGTSKKSGFVKLGEFLQVIDPPNRQSKNIVHFSAVTGGGGTFTITADYKVVNDVRVDVTTTATALEPDSFERLLGDNQDLLLQIFDPTGYLDITYVDESLRIGRDNKGHVFVLEKLHASSC